MDGFDISRINDKRLRSETVSSTYEMGRYAARRDYFVKLKRLSGYDYSGCVS